MYHVCRCGLSEDNAQGENSLVRVSIIQDVAIYVSSFWCFSKFCHFVGQMDTYTIYPEYLIWMF